MDKCIDCYRNPVKQYGEVCPECAAVRAQNERASKEIFPLLEALEYCQSVRSCQPAREDDDWAGLNKARVHKADADFLKELDALIKSRMAIVKG